MIATHVNVNDETIEGMRHENLPILGLMFDPEDSFEKDEFNQLYFDKLMNIRLLGAFLDASKMITDVELTRNEVFGLVVGNEARGISDDLKKNITERFKIPGNGEAESLNVGVALGISLFHLYNKQYNNNNV